MIYVLLLINIVMLVSGQILWKTGMSRINLELSMKGILNVIFNGYILGGIAIYAAATIIWIYILSKCELSRVYPLQSLCYVIGIMAGVFVFGESFTLRKAVGAAFIIIGSVIINTI